MSNIKPFFQLCELRPGLDCPRAVARVLRYWEARNFKKNNELMSINMLLLDEKGTLMQASIPRHLTERFKHLLKEDSVFSISDFEISSSSNRFRLTDHEFMLHFSDRTQIEEVNSAEYHINHEKFRFRTYDEFLHLADSNLELPDVIGLVSRVIEPSLESNRSLKRATIRIILDNDVNVSVTVWGDKAMEFCERLRACIGQVIVVVVTNVNPKMFAGNLYLNTTSSTKLFLNPDFDEAVDFRRRSTIDNDDQVAAISNEVNHTSCCIADIYKFLYNEKEQEKDFICTAKVTSIASRNGWSYVSCSKCSTKLGRSDISLHCNKCRDSASVGVLRFRIELCVEDSTDSGTFVIFDRDAQKLTNNTASDLMACIDQDARVEEIPKCISDLIGRKFEFHLKVKPYDFRSMYKRLTVSRVVSEKKEEVAILYNVTPTDSNNVASEQPNNTHRLDSSCIDTLTERVVNSKRTFVETIENPMNEALINHHEKMSSEGQTKYKEIVIGAEEVTMAHSKKVKIEKTENQDKDGKDEVQICTATNDKRVDVGKRSTVTRASGDVKYRKRKATVINGGD